MPNKPTPQGEKTINSQKDRRYSDTFFDQHKCARFPQGRPWWGEREFLSGNTSASGGDPFVNGELWRGNHEVRGEEWDAPWIAEWNGGIRQSFYELDPHKKRVHIRYDRIIAHDRLALDNYYRAAAVLAGTNGWGEVKYGVAPSFQVQSLIGPPTRSPAIAQAAQAGDPWILGFTDEANDELAKLLGITTSGMRRPEVVPAIKPETVLASSPTDLAALIVQIMDARDEQKRKAKMEHVRAGKKARGEAA